MSKLAVILSSVCFAALLHLPCVSGQFLGLRNASLDDVVSSVNLAMHTVLSGSGGVDLERVAAIEKSIAHTFQALPKNTLGRLGPRSVRHLVSTFFAREHGWILEGLEALEHANRSGIHSVSILQDRAPVLVDALLEETENGHGLSFEDVTVVIAATERLVFHESNLLLRAAYSLNGMTVMNRITREQTHEVLMSYLVLFRQGRVADFKNVSLHRRMKIALARYDIWKDMVEYEQDALINYDYAHQPTVNPFQSRQYSFHSAAKVVEGMAHNYGKWQDADCTGMRDHLIELDSKGNGRVPLDVFYRQPADRNMTYHFHESAEYLRGIGALEEVKGRTPQVRIANYVAGPGNCIARNPYYTVCCISECESLMTELEAEVRAPTASPLQLLDVVGKLSSSTVDAPRVLSKDLVEKLDMISRHHDGGVPLHGRLFAQWLHFAFPYDCSYPYQASGESAFSPSRLNNSKVQASHEERSEHMNADSISDLSNEELEALPAMSQWSDDEVLPLLDDVLPRRSIGAQILGNLVRLTAIGCFGYSAYSMFRNSMSEAEDHQNLRKDHFV